MEWLDSPTYKEFSLVLRSKVAVASDKLVENHCSRALDFLSTGKNSEEFLSQQQQMARIAICLEVFEELREESARRAQANEAPFEIVIGTDLDI